VVLKSHDKLYKYINQYVDFNQSLNLQPPEQSTDYFKTYLN